MKCPQKGCNAPARLLFSLVCANPFCRNYDAKWQEEAYSEPSYKHNIMGRYKFLGGYIHNNIYYDLYHSINPLDGTEWMEARYSNELGDYDMEEMIFAPISKKQYFKEAYKRWINFKNDTNYVEVSSY